MVWDFSSFQGNVAVKDEEGQELLYSQMMEIGRDIKDAIGDRCLVFSMCRNSIGSVVGYYAFVSHGIVPVLLNHQLEKELLGNLIKIYQPEFLWVPSEETARYDDYDFSKVYSACDYSLLRTNFRTKYPMYEELCLMLTTSGSTGSPKFVRQSYKNVRANAESIADYLKLTAEERPITTLPMNYTYGLSIINSHFMVGATILLTDKGLMQKDFWSFFKNEKATSFGGVPYTYEMLDRLRFYRMELPSLRYMTQAGGKLLPELHEKFAEYAHNTGRQFVVMYGQCEATARMGYLPAEKSLEKCGSMGIAIPGGKFYLKDDNGQIVTSPFITGELIYEGPNVTLGYAERGEDLVKGDERNGILQTGDMAKFDQDGFYFIVGRKKRFLKIYGNRVNLDEIDGMIKARFHIEVASAGFDDHMYLFVKDASMAELVRNYVIEKTKLNPMAFKTIVIDEIPKNDSGKIMYKELERYYC